MICGSGGSKSRIAKAAGAEPSGQMRDEKVHTVVARSTFVSEKAKNTSRSDHSWKLRCRKVHAVVARSTFRSQNVQDTPMSDHFWKLRCRKVHAVVARSTFRSQNVGPLLEVEMSKKCTPLWREAHFEVKMYNIPHARTTFGGSDVVSRGRRTGLCTLSKMSKNVRVLSHFQKPWQAWGI